MNKTTTDQLVGFLRNTTIALVRREEPDLTARQLAVFLTCYIEAEAQTVRGLAAELRVSKPAITRALDRLTDLELVRRKVDPMDRRSVLVQRTTRGNMFLRDLVRIMGEVAIDLRDAEVPAAGDPRPAARATVEPERLRRR